MKCEIQITKLRRFCVALIIDVHQTKSHELFLTCSPLSLTHILHFNDDYNLIAIMYNFPLTRVRGSLSLYFSFISTKYKK